MAQRVCRWCKNKGEMEDMIAEQSGKSNKYYHESCYVNEYLPDKEFKQEQMAKKDKLYDKVAEIYNIPKTELPKPYFVFIENLRNGEEVFKGQRRSEKYKEGYDYDIIEKTYDYCRNDIQYWNEAKDFDSVYTSLRYGLRIIIDKINYVNRQHERYNEEHSVAKKKTEKNTKPTFASTYRKTKYEKDISEFLDE